MRTKSSHVACRTTSIKFTLYYSSAKHAFLNAFIEYIIEIKAAVCTINSEYHVSRCSNSRQAPNSFEQAYTQVWLLMPNISFSSSTNEINICNISHAGILYLIGFIVTYFIEIRQKYHYKYKNMNKIRNQRSQLKKIKYC